MYSIGLLPVAGTYEIGDTVAARRQAMRETLRIIDGIRTSPHGLSFELRRGLDNLRFHVGAALAFIDTFLRSGGHVSDLASEVDNLDNSVKLFLSQLPDVKEAWNVWVRSTQQQAMFADFGADAPTETVTVTAPVEETDVDITPEDLRPPPISQNMLFLGGAVAVAGLIWLTGRK